MKTQILLRTSLLAAVLGAALTVQAIPFSLTAVGNDSFYLGPHSSNGQVISQTQGIKPISSARYLLPNAIIPGDGTGAFDGLPDSNYVSLGQINFTIHLASGSFVTSQLYQFTGTWEITSKTKGFSNITGGSGTFTTTLDLLSDKNNSYSVYSGNLTVVPEPASLAAFGLGAAVLLRRRKKGGA